MKVIDAYQNNIHLKVKMVKLFLFKARDAPIVVILRRVKQHSRTLWQLIRWNTDTDTFQPGQWLKCAQQMRAGYCSLSPDGKHFAYSYSILGGIRAYESNGIVSVVPYFTATMFAEEFGGAWNCITFHTNGQPMCTLQTPITYKRPSALKQVEWDKSSQYTGYIESGSCTDSQGRIITVDEGRVLADGAILYDTTDHVFQEVPYPSTPHSHPYFTRSKAVHATK